jgi:hypothetical protein
MVRLIRDFFSLFQNIFFSFLRRSQKHAKGRWGKVRRDTNTRITLLFILRMPFKDPEEEKDINSVQM